MEVVQTQLQIQTPGQGLHECTSLVQDFVWKEKIAAGVCHLFIRHTSASLTIQENADPSARRDLEYFLNKLIPDGDAGFTHTSEGPDDMPSHIKSALTSTSLSVPIADGALALGTWQGIYVWEHRVRPHTRNIFVSLQGKRISE